MLDVCRICLCTGGRMFTMNKYKLQDTFEHITGISLQDDNTFPRMLCTECAQKLSNCGNLRAKSLRANDILTKLAIQHGNLTLPKIKTIDRYINQLHSNLHTKLYEPDHYDFLIEHTDVNLANVKIKTESFDEIYLEENDVFADGETSADQGFEDHISPSSDCQKATDSDIKVESSLEGNEFENRLVLLESVEIKFEPDDGTDLDGSVAECGVVVKQEYPGEDTSVGRQRDHEIYPSCSGRPPLSNSMLNDDNEKRTETEVLNTEHVKKEMAKEVQERPLNYQTTETKSRKPPRQNNVAINAKNNKKRLDKLNDTISNKMRRCSKKRKCDLDSQQCEICGKRIKYTSSYKDHIRTHTGDKPYSCKICNKTFAQSSHLRNHIKTHTGEKPYVCEICAREFNRKASLERHQLIHTGERPYSCEICGKKFVQLCNLKRHVKIHTSEKPYSCEICGKKFIKKDILNVHQRVHTEERHYSCEICGKKFNRKDILNAHQRVHTEDRPYSCEICNKKFLQNSDLMKHQRIHTGERPYSCETCGKKFVESSNFRRHVKIHSSEKSYSCEICGKRFNRKYVLNAHQRVHTKDRPYSCEICNKKFIQNSDLMKHQRVHTGEKPYSCEICKKTFNDSTNLKVHIKKQHERH